TVKLLKGKWKSIRDAYTRHLRLLRDFRSGVAVCAPGDYVHAKELKFLRSFLALGCMGSCWEESTQNNVLDKDAISHKQAKSLQRAKCQLQHVLPLRHLWETSPHHPFVLVYLQELTYMQQEGGLLLDIMASMSYRMNTNRSHVQVSARCLEGLMEKLPSELQADMLAGTIRYIATFIPPTTTYRSSEPPPPYGPYESLPRPL
ncbi:hypothetical protein AB205_0191400, partial [Aquarana catesbeiana]